MILPSPAVGALPRGQPPNQVPPAPSPMPSDNKPGWRQITFISWQALPAGAPRCCPPGHCNILRQSVTCRSGFARDFQPRLPRAERPCQGCRPRRRQIGGPAGPVRWRRLATRWRPGRPAACPPAQAALWTRQCWRQDAPKKRRGWPPAFFGAAKSAGDARCRGQSWRRGRAAKANEPAAEAKPRTSEHAIGRTGPGCAIERRRTQVSVTHTLRRYKRLEDTSRATYGLGCALRIDAAARCSVAAIALVPLHGCQAWVLPPLRAGLAGGSSPDVAAMAAFPTSERSKSTACLCTSWAFCISCRLCKNPAVS